MTLFEFVIYMSREISQSLISILRGRYWSVEWVLEESKKYLLGNDGGCLTVCNAVMKVQGVSYEAKAKARALVQKAIFPHVYLIYHLEEQGLLPPPQEEEERPVRIAELMRDPVYFFLRDRWVDDLIRKLRYAKEM